MVNKPKLWAFGCSFTALNYVKGLSDYHWSKYLSSEYKLHLKNLGLSASSNDNILFELLQNAYKFKEGDYVIVQLTHSSRLGIPTIFNGKTNFINVHPYLAHFIRKAQKEKLTSLDMGARVGRVPIDEIDQMMAYTVNIWAQRYNVNEKYYLDKLKGIFKLIKDKGIKFFYWDSSLWEEFETIELWSGYNDGHWSPNGNYAFFKYLDFIFKNNHHSLELWSYSVGRRTFKDWYKDNIKSKRYKYNYIGYESLSDKNKKFFEEEMRERKLKKRSL